VIPGLTQLARARLALVACVLWLTGVEAFPALHEALHDRLAAHRHDHGSMIVVASFEDTTHRHPDGSIHYVAPRHKPTARPANDGRPRATAPSDHADGLAHHAAALAPAAPPVTQPLPVDRRPIEVAMAPSLALIDTTPPAASARGPPTPS
jgi:hypothetical protein